MKDVQSFHDDSLEHFTALLAKLTARCSKKTHLRGIQGLTGSFLAFLDRLELTGQQLLTDKNDESEEQSDEDRLQTLTIPSSQWSTPFLGSTSSGSNTATTYVIPDGGDGLAKSLGSSSNSFLLDSIASCDSKSSGEDGDAKVFRWLNHYNSPQRPKKQTTSKSIGDDEDYSDRPGWWDGDSSTSGNDSKKEGDEGEKSDH